MMKHEAWKTLIKKQTFAQKEKGRYKREILCYQETTPKSIDASIEATKENKGDSPKGVKIIT